MNICTAIVKMKNEGYELSVNGDKLHVESDQPLTEEQRQYLKHRKPEIIQYLIDNALDAAKERAAIMEFDGGLSRSEAESRAIKAHLKDIHLNANGTYLH